MFFLGGRGEMEIVVMNDELEYPGKERQSISDICAKHVFCYCKM